MLKRNLFFSRESSDYYVHLKVLTCFLKIAGERWTMTLCKVTAMISAGFYWEHSPNPDCQKEQKE